MTDDFGLCSRSGIDQVIAQLHQSGDLRFMPIWRSIRDHGAALVALLPGQRMPRPKPEWRDRPHVICIQDDIKPAGPAAFDNRYLRRACRIAGAAILASAYPPAAWYEQAAISLAAGRNLLIADCTASHELVWLKWFQQNLPPPDQCQYFLALDIDGPTNPGKRGVAAATNDRRPH